MRAKRRPAEPVAHRHRRRRAALPGHRADGGDGLRGDASLRPDRMLRPRHHLPVAAGAGGHAAGRARPPSWRGRASTTRCWRKPRCSIPATMAPVARGRRDAGRGDAARQYRDEGLPAQPGSQPRGLRRRLVPHRRPRRDASGRLYRGEGPRQGHRHLRRRERLDAGGGGGALRPPRHHGSGGGRRSRTRNGARCRMPSSPRRRTGRRRPRPR